MTLGAQVEPGGVRFRVWAPKRVRVDVVLEEDGRSFPLTKDDRGYFSGHVPIAAAGMSYRYRLDNGEAYPDPCSRFQPQGPHGPSLIVNPGAYRWRLDEWPGLRMPGQVIYELHVGTFTPAGTLDAAQAELDELRDAGVTVIELMPLAEFPGRWNWGYDGVDLFAPSHVYGDHEALKRFVDAAHARGLGVILDVVYNHFGPDGNYLPLYSEQYASARHPTEWGQAVNFDGPGAEGVRDFVVQNACYWLAEYRLDGLRLDAVHAIYDDSPVHILAELSQQARAAAGDRTVLLTAECESQLIQTVRPIDRGGWGLDGVWSDDFHHIGRVALTGRRDAYYSDYRGTAQELVSIVKRGFVYQGQRYEWQDKPRGTAVKDERASAFVFFLQNHDQIANHVRGDRLTALAGPDRYRALTALFLLAPETPLLFMGQEFAASSPFLYFCDHADPRLAEAVYQGRKRFLSEFPSYATPEAQAAIPDPCDPATFERSKLDLSERVRHAGVYRLHKDLLRLRREDMVLARQDRSSLDGAVLGPQALALRYCTETDDDRLLLVDLGPDLAFVPAPEPLLAPVSGGKWRLLWSSDDPRYGGSGVVNPLSDTGWRLKGGSATLFAAVKR
ncbi:Malto-oligosyltrehalose trehalohydrolase [Nitrospira moscoviensis]|uniref:Malto-oligosyltrehalose trehalohydrolase n=2 Tax=Nitrospira moscoviensis TaxID=42253 RepID=A0A0K2GE03_NITMO|nr:Malto-oligosyltrehalose trehalohydrolase [Nitrospira moscoviensis]